MKKSVALIIASIVLVMCCTVAFAAEEKNEGDTETFKFQEKWTWGMNQDEVEETLGNVKPDVEKKQKLVYVEADDDDSWTFEKIPAEIKFALKDDKLVIISLSFDNEDPGVTEQAIMDALEKLYGKGAELADKKIVDDLTAYADADEINLDESREDSYSYFIWELDNGTTILLQKEIDKEEANDIDFHLAFFESAILK